MAQFQIEGTTLKKCILEEGETVVGVPDGVTAIGSILFAGCETLQEIRIPDSVRSIGREAFCLCRSLREIRLPDGLEKLDAYAFYGCQSLRKVRFPAQLDSMWLDAFGECPALCELEFAEFPEPGSPLHAWLTFFLKDNPQAAASMYREKTLTKQLAEIALNLAQETNNPELTALMLQFLHENADAESGEMYL